MSKKEAHQRWREANREKACAKVKAWYKIEENKTKRREYMRNYYIQNKSKWLTQKGQ